MRVAEGEERREKGEKMQRTDKRERERMNKIYYFCLQFDEQLVVNMETDVHGCLTILDSHPRMELSFFVLVAKIAM